MRVFHRLSLSDINKPVEMMRCGPPHVGGPPAGKVETMEKTVPRSALVQFCVAIGYDPGAVRMIHFEPDTVAIERYVLDADGEKQFDGIDAITAVDNLPVAG